MQLYGGHTVNTILSTEWIRIDLQYPYKKPSNPFFTEKLQEVQTKIIKNSFFNFLILIL